MRFDKRQSKKSKSGYTWRVTLEYKDQYGKSKRYSKSGFTTKKEAQLHGLEVQKKLDKGIDLEARKITVNNVFEEWKKITTLKETTVVNYCTAYKHVKPLIGDVEISSIRYPQLQSVFTSLSGCGKGTVTTARKVLKCIGDLAIRSGYIESWSIDLVEIQYKDNKRKRTSEYMPLSEMIALTESVRDCKEPFNGEARRMVILLGYYAGLRIGECLGLLWEDVDFEKGVLHVKHQLKGGGYLPGELEIVESLKSESSTSDVPISKPLLKELKMWKEENPYPYVVCSIEGDLYRSGSVNDLIKKRAKKLGIEYHHHMLRHTYVTNLLLAGVDVKTASELARHKDVSTTLGIYAEVIGNQKAESINKTFGSDELEVSENILA